MAWRCNADLERLRQSLREHHFGVQPGPGSSGRPEQVPRSRDDRHRSVEFCLSGQDDRNQLPGLDRGCRQHDDRLRCGRDLEPGEDDSPVPHARPSPDVCLRHPGYGQGPRGPSGRTPSHVRGRSDQKVPHLRQPPVDEPGLEQLRRRFVWCRRRKLAHQGARHRQFPAGRHVGGGVEGFRRQGC